MKIALVFGSTFALVSDIAVVALTTGVLVVIFDADITLVIGGVGLLLIKLSTRADVTLGTMGGANVLVKGGTIGMNGIGCGGFIVEVILVDCGCNSGFVSGS